MKLWLADINTTNFRIVVSIGLAAFMVLTAWTAILFFAWVPNAMQLRVIGALGGGVLTMMGFDVAQFIGKRFSAAEYAAAKIGVAVGRTEQTAANPGESSVHMASSGAIRVHPAP